MKSIIVPYGDLASVWSAYGVATGDIMHVFEYAHVFGEPFDTKAVSRIFLDLTARAADAFKSERVEAGRIKYRYEIGLRYKTQLNEVYVDVERVTEFDETSLAATVARFEERYATVFGAEAGFREAGIELVDFREVDLGGLVQEAPPIVRRQLVEKGEDLALAGAFELIDKRNIEHGRKLEGNENRFSCENRR